MRDPYYEHTARRKTRYGYMVKCKKGLWRVDAPDKEQAHREARRYFALYYMDGEYGRDGE